MIRLIALTAIILAAAVSTFSQTASSECADLKTQLDRAQTRLNDWPALAPDRLANGAFKDQPFIQKFAHQQTRDAAPYVHQARQVGA